MAAPGTGPGGGTPVESAAPAGGWGGCATRGGGGTDAARNSADAAANRRRAELALKPRKGTTRVNNARTSNTMSYSSGAWRSSVARLLWEQEVAGSNPAAPIMRAGPPVRAPRRSPCASCGPSAYGPRLRPKTRNDRSASGFMIHDTFTGSANDSVISISEPAETPRLISAAPSVP